MATAILAANNARAQTILAILDSGGTAGLLLDQDGWVTARNGSADNILSALLHFEPLAGRQTLQSVGLLPDCDTTDAGCEYSGFSECVIETPEHHRLLTYVVTGNQKDDQPFSHFQDILVAFDIRNDAAINAAPAAMAHNRFCAALRNTFSLTQSEAELAKTLLCKKLPDAAKTHNIAYETAGTHLKAIFAKTGVRSQSELTAFLSRIAYHASLRETLQRLQGHTSL